MEPRGVAIESVSLQGNRGLAVFSLSILMSIISYLNGVRDPQGFA